MKQRVLRTAAERLPSNLKSLARRLYYKDRHWAHPKLKGFGTVQDLYYWVSDGNLDTLLVLQNYFSAFYPSIRTDTTATISLYSKDGVFLGSKAYSLADKGGVKTRVSSLLAEMPNSTDHTFGTLEVNIAIPHDVLEHIQEQKALYFWDRFYIGYVNALGQTCFVHGVDKTHFYREGTPDVFNWVVQPAGHQWAPEIPVDIDDYQRFSVIMINRSARDTNVTLVLSDIEDESLSWEARISPNGVHRFELTRENTSRLHPTELRMRVMGMPTQFGRPVVFKEFHNGAISAMHC